MSAETKAITTALDISGKGINILFDYGAAFIVLILIVLLLILFIYTLFHRNQKMADNTVKATVQQATTLALFTEAVNRNSAEIRNLTDAMKDLGCRNDV